MNRMNFSPAALPIQTITNLCKNVNKNGLDLQPTYQRGYVWNDDFKYKLIYSIVKRYPIGNISIRNLESPNNKNAKSEVVDGQQRLTTIYNFIHNDVAVKGEFAKKIIEEIKEYLDEANDKTSQRLLKKLHNKGKITLKYSDLPEDVKLNINAFPISVTNISNATDEQITEYFNFLQNQERLRAGEIINSIPDTKLEIYLNKIIDKEKFLKILTFSDSRKEFDKIFYSLIGLFDKEISFGTTDKQIKEYVSNKSNDLNIETQNYIYNMINIINRISENGTNNMIKSNKRYIKLLLLLAGFSPQYFDNDINSQLIKLQEINNRISAFNSAKKNMIKDTFVNYTDKEIENYRLIALLTKGAHTFDRVKNRIELLATLN